MKILCRVTDIGLMPMYDSDYDEKKKLRVGDTVLCDIKRPRNYEFHKKFFALIRLTFENLPEHLHNSLHIYSEEDMLLSLKIDLGLCTTVRYGFREVIKEKSISFSAMDETEFQRFYSRSIDMILHRYLRGTDRQALIEEIERFK